MYSQKSLAKIRKLEAFLGVRDLSDCRDAEKPDYEQPKPKSDKDRKVLFSFIEHPYPEKIEFFHPDDEITEEELESQDKD